MYVFVYVFITDNLDINISLIMSTNTIQRLNYPSFNFHHINQKQSAVSTASRSSISAALLQFIPFHVSVKAQSCWCLTRNTGLISKFETAISLSPVFGGCLCNATRDEPKTQKRVNYICEHTHTQTHGACVCKEKKRNRVVKREWKWFISRNMLLFLMSVYWKTKFGGAINQLPPVHHICKCSACGWS